MIRYSHLSLLFPMAANGVHLRLCIGIHGAQLHFFSLMRKNKSKQLCIAIFILLWFSSIYTAHANPFNLAAGLPQQTYTVTLQEMEREAAILLARMGAGDAVKATVIGNRTPVQFSYNTPLSFLFDALDYNAHERQWNAVLHIYSGDNILHMANISGHYDPLVDVPVLTRRFGSDDVITDADIRWIKVSEHRMRKDAVLDEHQLYGKSPRRSISANRPIRASEIRNPIIISRNSTVPMRYITPHMEISTMGVTIDDGAHGDIIRVRNSDSNVVVKARVHADGYVIAGAGMSLASNFLNTQRSRQLAQR